MAIRVLATLLLLGAVLPCSAATTRNDDSCDIAVLPAATLLLPYFEVNPDSPAGDTTLFTITNVGNLDQIARVTLWTDRAYPVISFDIYLTGYDAQSINLYDVIERGFIAPDAGTGTAIYWSKRQKYSDVNPDLDLSRCARLPGALDDSIVERMQLAFIEGTVGTCASAGNVHANAIGYATIDVVGSCSSLTPADAAYWTRDIRYDNVLTGDYEQVNSADNSAQGSPLIHIRAVPEGGTPLERMRAEDDRYDAGFARTFYGRYQPKDTPRLDGRQPLPSRFAARWIQGGTADFRTRLKVWREGTGASTCGAFAASAALDVGEIVVFDEAENAVGTHGASVLSATSATSVTDSAIYPQLASGTTSGWLYLDLDDGSDADVASQSWVVSSMRAEGRFSTDSDAVAMGNGCSLAIAHSEVTNTGGPRIGPAANNNHRETRAATDNDDSCDVGLYPAATLLLPYFEVDLDNRAGETTLFTVTNVSNRDQIARVTLWTDYGFPTLSFNLYLTGYDVQSINLFDVIASGIIAPDAGAGTARGTWSDPNSALDLGACGRLPGQLSDAYIERMQDAFTNGAVPSYNAIAGCNNVGNSHDNAVGYATIDLVRNCSSNLPTSPEYWTQDIAYDNVLIGDHQQVNSENNFAQGSPLVHIRAIPEGGMNAERIARPGLYDAGFERTFYARFQPATAPKLDARQPLPSRFAARWISGGASSFDTELKIWREGIHGMDGVCSTWDDNVMTAREVVRFDDAENMVGEASANDLKSDMGWWPVGIFLSATSRTSVRDDDIYPQLTNGAISGWIYINLDNSRLDSWGSNNWVVTSMRAEGRYSVDFDATGLGNGCSPPTGKSEVTTGTYTIGPSRNQ